MDDGSKQSSDMWDERPSKPSITNHRVPHGRHSPIGSTAAQLDPKAAPVAAELLQQGALLDELGHVINELADRLQPALTPTPPSDAREGASGPGSSDLYHNIAAKNQTLVNYIDTVRSLIQRVEL
jgi:hypothetical protein